MFRSKFLRYKKKKKKKKRKKKKKKKVIYEIKNYDW